LFFTGKFSPKREFQNSKFKKIKLLWRFLVARSEGKKKTEKICQIRILGSHCVTKNIEG
jgi:hypothetical protein